MQPFTGALVTPRLGPALLALAFLALSRPAPACAAGVVDPPVLPSDPDLLARASAGGKYADLVATIEVPEDATTYGAAHDHGVWGGGPYRGIPDTPAGFWVWVAPRWYVWKTLVAPGQPQPELPPRANPHRPRPPAPPPAPDLDGPLGPVHRYLQEKQTGIGTSDLDPALGYMVPAIRTSRGGFLFSALRDDRTEADRELRDRDGYRLYVVGKTVPLVVKLDPAGKVEWERSYRKKGFVDYGAGWVAEAADGDFLAMVPSYVNPGRSPVHRFLKLRRATGEVVWERQLRGTGGRDSPIVDVARLLPGGRLALAGRISFEQDTQNVWRGEIGADGRMILDRSGPAVPLLGDGPVGAWSFDERNQGWLKDAAAGTSNGYAELRPAYVHAIRNGVVLAHQRRHLAPGLGWMIPAIRDSRSGVVLAGVRSDGPGEAPAQGALAPVPRTRPVVVKVDAEGRPEWERSLEAPGFDAYGAGLVLEAPGGGYLVAVPSYVLGTWGVVTRFVKLDRSGAVAWERALPVVGSTGRSPEVERVRLGERGTLVVRGFAYADGAFRKVREYDGEIDGEGRLVRNELGRVRRPGTAAFVVWPDGKPLDGDD